MMDINSIFGFDRGANREAADFARQNGGQVSLNPLQRLFGAEEDDVQNILNKELQERLNSQYGAALATVGRGGAQWGETETALQARLAQGGRDQKAQAAARTKQDTIDAESRALTSATQLRNLDLQAGRDQYAHQTQTQEARYSHERNQNRMDRRHQSELSDQSNDLQMQMSLMQSDLAEKRMDYDRETRRLDKRSEAIAQLMGGLGQLGGAFAL